MKACPDLAEDDVQEALYGRPVDLVSAGALQNPSFIEAVNKTPRPSFARS